jgi:hypothetical protein
VTLAETEMSIEPGLVTIVVPIATTSVAPANTTVRPAARERGGVLDGPARRPLLAVARDHQKRVVDAEREPHHRGDRQGDDVDGHRLREQRYQPPARDHAGAPEQQRDRRGEGRPEDQ